MEKKQSILVSSIGQGVLIFLALFGVYLYEHRTVGQHFLYLVVLFGVVSLALCIKQERAGRFDTRKFFYVNEASKKHNYAYDYLRLYAACTVILTHTVQAAAAEADAKGMALILSYSLTCNMMYVMLSGALLFPWKEEGILSFYKKRITTVLYPLCIYYVFYMWWAQKFAFISPGGLKEMTVNFFTCNIAEAPHFWLIFVILSLYVATPFIRYFLKDVPYRILTAMVVVIYLFMFTSLFLPNLILTTFLSKWVGVALIGYWVSRQDTFKYRHITVAVGFILGALPLAVIVFTRDNYMDYVNNLSPFMALMTMGVFCLIFHSVSLFKKGNAFIRFLSKYSYSVILIHWWALYYVTRDMLHIEAWSFGGVGVVLSLVVTFAVAFAVSYVIDHLCLIVRER